jgi:hypothetical protein
MNCFQTLYEVTWKKLQIGQNEIDWMKGNFEIYMVDFFGIEGFLLGREAPREWMNRRDMDNS